MFIITDLIKIQKSILLVVFREVNSFTMITLTINSCNYLTPLFFCNIFISMDIDMNIKEECCKKNSSKYQELGKITKFLSVISDNNRLRIICLLRTGEKCVCEIYEALNLPQNLTSHHLKSLEKQNCVLREKRGKKVFYKLNSKELKNNFKFLNNLLPK